MTLSFGPVATHEPKPSVVSPQLVARDPRKAIGARRHRRQNGCARNGGSPGERTPAPVGTQRGRGTRAGCGGEALREMVSRKVAKAQPPTRPSQTGSPRDPGPRGKTERIRGGDRSKASRDSSSSLARVATMGLPSAKCQKGARVALTSSLAAGTNRIRGSAFAQRTPPSRSPSWGGRGSVVC